jgi:hypothetical protein
LKIKEVDDYLDALGEEHSDPENPGGMTGVKAIAAHLGMSEEEQGELWDICRDDVAAEVNPLPAEVKALCSMYMHVGFLLGTKWQMEREDA